VLSLDVVNSLEPGEAAAYFVVRRSEGLTESEQEVLEAWLAANAANREALANAEYVWQVFDGLGDE
jgi:ferric-dicitrate binding protein FerR (iron transport regulator)